MNFLTDGPETAPFTIVFAHGAGVGMDAPFMAAFADGLAAKGHRVVRFEFPYMAQRRADGTRRPPDKPEILFRAFGEAIERASPAGKLILAGKSMGGRIATMLADRTGAAGVLAFGYPFHPPGKPENLRTQHLESIRTPTLICQGARDPFGTRDEVATYQLSSVVQFCWLDDGDHDFKPRKASGATLQTNWIEAIEAAAGFIESLN